MATHKTDQSEYCQISLYDGQGRLLSGDQHFADENGFKESANGESVERIGDCLVLRRPAGNLLSNNSNWGDFPTAALLVARFDRLTLRRRLEAIGHAYGLSDRQIDLIDALLEAGSLPEAASLLGLAYGSARNTLAEVKSKTGLATIPLIVGMMFELLGSPTKSHGALVDRHDLFGLTDRQYAIASSIGIFKTRNEIARRLQISGAVVDSELKTIYLVLGVRSAGEVSRFIAETRLSLARTKPTSNTLTDPWNVLPHERLTFASRNIGYSDFGPTDGRPVFILHSTITSRAPPTRLVAALRHSGFRPIAVDRPGFGDTDWGQLGDDPYALPAADMALVCDALRLTNVDVIARGSGHTAVRLAQIKPKLVGRTVLVNPTPAVAHTRVDRGPLGAVKRRFAKSPRATEALIRVLAAYANPRRMHDGMTRSFRGSAPDEALVRDDPQFVADYLRATRSFADGVLAGYVAEQTAWASGYDIDPLPAMIDWRIVQGRHFILHHPDQAMTYWRERLPDTPITWVDDAGQMLAYSHPEAVVKALFP